MGLSNTLKRPFVWKTSLLLLVLLVAFVAIRANRQSARLAEVIESVRERGEPVTPDEWNDYVSEAMSQTEPSVAWKQALAAATVVANKKEQAGLSCDNVFDERLELPHFGQPWEDFDAYAALLAENKKEMATIHKAADAGESMFYPYDFADDEDQAGLIWEAYEVGGLLTLEALVNQRQADLEGSIRSLRAIHNTAKAMDGMAHSYEYLIRFCIENMLFRSMAEIIQDQHVSGEQLQHLQSLLHSMDQQQDLRQMCIGSRIAGLVDLETASVGSFMLVDLPFGLRLNATTRAKVRCVNTHTNVIAATAQPWPEFLKNLEEIDFERQANRSWIAEWLPSSDYFTAGEFYYGAMAAAQARSLDALIALELYRRREGQIPAGLDELVPEFLTEVPLDPFDGNPLRYRSDESGAAVYSVGENLVDDQGSLKFAPGIEIRPDIGFHVDRTNLEPESTPQPDSDTDAE